MMINMYYIKLSDPYHPYDIILSQPQIISISFWEDLFISQCKEKLLRVEHKNDRRPSYDTVLELS